MERLEGADAVALRALMRQMPLWADFVDADLDLLLRAGAVGLRQFASGETLVEEGNYEKTFFILLGGAVRIVRGGRALASLDGPGTIFGEMSFILGKGRTATVVATAPTECLAVDMGYVDFLPSPEREDFLIRIFRRLAVVVAGRLGSANARKAALLAAIRERREALRAIVAAEREVITGLRRELASLDTADDEAVLRELLDRKF
ncbi:MAG: cyclic nucleotide-binding domain-containing protein [Solidesulfovibrio sp. DCME]|uniref:cyclic nucleotide-binding domain-containing protein n=1 Tax=Solidesulfovibrio sp. DCME TaxID=3447380 RepID=UPI003D142531